MDTTRRAFIGSSAFLAAGAAFGIGRRIKTHGPVDLKTDIFGPITLRSILSADEDRNIFGVRVLANNAPSILVEMDLSKIKTAMESGRSCLTVKVVDKYGSVEAVRQGGRLSFLVAERTGSPTPFWLEVADVRRVL